VARGNLWLLLAGASVLAVTLAPGQEGFVDLVGRAYVRHLPQFGGLFRPDLVVQTRWLYWILMCLGGCALAGYGLLLRSRLRLAGWLLGQGGPDDQAALAIALLLTISYSSLFVSIRAVRDGLRFRDVAGLSMEQRKLLLFGRHTGEPDYGPARDFRERASGRGNLAILREGRRGGYAQVFYASYLFPIRTYVIRADSCAQAARLALASSEPRFDWIDADCKGGFDPRPRADLP